MATVLEWRLGPAPAILNTEHLPAPSPQVLSCEPHKCPIDRDSGHFSAALAGDRRVGSRLGPFIHWVRGASSAEPAHPELQ